ncbi:MAG: HD domain-containing protein [Bacillota bacterium]
MDLLNRLINHPRVRAAFTEIAAWEKDRIYCRHGWEHAWAVARLAYMLYLEERDEREPEAREGFYAAGLLHDLGRAAEYATGEDHAQVSARLAGEILVELGMPAEFIYKVCQAIAGHRRGEEEGWARYLYLADKLSRPCLQCVVEDCYKREKMLVLQQLYDYR